MFEEKKNVIFPTIVILLLVIFVAWGVVGRITLNNVKDFKHGDDIKYRFSIMKHGGSGVDTKSMEVQYTEDADNVFKLLKSELKYKSMKVCFPLSNHDSLQLYKEYNNFYLRYYSFVGENGGKYYSMNMSSQENASYIDFSVGILDIRIMVEHDGDLTDYLEGLFE